MTDRWVPINTVHQCPKVEAVGSSPKHERNKYAHEVICDRQSADTVTGQDVASEHVGLDADGMTSLNKIKLSEVGKLHLLLLFFLTRS